ncbi:hypothetical protein ACIBL3_33990 [Kribbella sp. NPDC050124]|uniref:hypothetical protein n=1 Tax=Kribbella sp. NPDC050124 TaxID=3364114 RepID=UPI0037BE0A11
MTEEGARAAPVPSPQPLNILDAVCVLYFAASVQLSLLVEILTAANYRILLPTEVLNEVRAKASRKRWTISALDHYLNSDADARIVEIPEITAAQAEAATLLAQVRSRHPNVVSGSTDINSSEDLGECVVVTHSILARRRGMLAVVSIDDLKGQKLAERHQVTYFTIEDAFSLALKHEILDTLNARKAYDKLRPFGDSLPSWEAELKPRLKRERAARKRAQ